MINSSLIGSTIGGYHIVDTIGRGGMGVVYKARDLELDRLTVVKMMEKSPWGDLFHLTFEGSIFCSGEHPPL
jgi:serine/threonine protein kinase